MSLDTLIPNRRATITSAPAPKKRIHPNHPIIPTPHSSSSTSTASELQRISRSSSAVLNNRDFSHTSALGQEVLACIAPDYTATLENFPFPLTWWALVDVWREWAAKDPRLTFDVKDCEAYVDEERGLATVYMETDLTGVANVELRAFTALKWRRDRWGRWVTYMFWASRGMPGMMGDCDG